jgi:hypothetical protein
MSQNGRREFLTSAAAVAAALAACVAPARRALAQGFCGTTYYEQGIVHIVAQHLHDANFLKNILTFPDGVTADIANLTPQFVKNTLDYLNSIGITTVTVRDSTYVPKGKYELVELIPSGTTPVNPQPPQLGKRSPVVLSLDQYKAQSFNPDWNRMLLFVLPMKDAHGNPVTTPGDAESAMCAHPFGM